MEWSRERVLVTGGASFIGSTLVDALLARGARDITIIDDFSSGRHEYTKAWSRDTVTVVESDLRDVQRLHDVSTAFHLAADHGGRGYVDLHQVGPGSNMEIDARILRLLAEQRLSDPPRCVFASSGCIYPNSLQTDTRQELYLAEDMAGPPYEPDNLYGWAKMSCELLLKAYCDEGKLRGASCRFFTVYGPRGKMDHAIMAFLGRALLRQDPFPIWGDGTQLRNWTYVDDIVEGMIRSAENIEDGSAVNLGTTERHTVKQAVDLSCQLAGYEPQHFDFQLTAPVGPVNRIASNALAGKRLDMLRWMPLHLGMEKTWAWLRQRYAGSEGRHELERALERPTER